MKKRMNIYTYSVLLLFTVVALSTLTYKAMMAATPAL